ncbi:MULTISPECIES: helix-turn-helix domain-containing protein [Providencia]|uniref:helix-turn-helix domain-containing protein n=1 Tax=Providencia TaxID=586 RepID=UPI001FBB99D6|nr:MULTISPECIES: helix-turn-helix domain-containing protein [Providencia]
MTNVNRIVGKEIRKRRKHLGLSGFELANLVGVSQQQISRYERGSVTLISKIYMFSLMRWKRR